MARENNDGLARVGNEHRGVPDPRTAKLVKNRRLHAFLAVAVVAIGLVSYFLTRNTRQELRADAAAAPGYDQSGESVNNVPFQLAEPTTTAGPTTIPGGPVAPIDETTTTGVDPAATPPDPAIQTGAPQTGPTAPPPTTPPIVSLPSIFDPGSSTTPTCSAYYLVMQAGRDTQNRFIGNPKASITAVRNLLLQRFDQALSVLDRAPTTPGPDLTVQQTLRSRIGQMRFIAAGVTTIEQGGDVFYPLQLPRAPAETVGWPEILDHLTRNCVDVYRSAGDTMPPQ